MKTSTTESTTTAPSRSPSQAPTTSGKGRLARRWIESNSLSGNPAQFGQAIFNGCCDCHVRTHESLRKVVFLEQLLYYRVGLLFSIHFRFPGGTARRCHATIHASNEAKFCRFSSTPSNTPFNIPSLLRIEFLHAVSSQLITCGRVVSAFRINLVP